MTDVGYLEQKMYGGGTDIRVFHKHVETDRARLAGEFLSRWGMVAAEPDGEDSAGRQKSKLMSPPDLVDRACVTADLFVSELEKRGWFLDLPDPKPSIDK